MSLKLVASNDDRLLAIRDHLLVLVRQAGGLEVQRDLVRLVTLELGPWVIYHWTPFNDLQPGEASSPGYRHAVERQHATSDLPYGLEVWHGAKVLSVMWADDGRFEAATFVRGSWENLALALVLMLASLFQLGFRLINQKLECEAPIWNAGGLTTFAST